VSTIDDSQNRDAWYNAVAPGLTSRGWLCSTSSRSRPALHAVHLCVPCAPQPGPPAFPTGTPSLSKAYFMYGINGRICINRSTRAIRKISNVRLPAIQQPSDTVFVAECNGNSSTAGSAQSNVTGRYAVARHERRGNFAMADGSARAPPRTNSSGPRPRRTTPPMSGISHARSTGTPTAPAQLARRRPKTS